MMYKRTIITQTIAIISYTDKKGVRHSEERIKFIDACISNKWCLYNALKKNKNYQKPYVHEIIESYYWEE